MEERLKKFAYVVDAGSFTKAAAELYISQPALSSAISKLERELKARLIVQGIRPLTLTPAGKLAYQSAKDLQVHIDNLRLKLAELAHEQIAIKIGMIDSVADTLFSVGPGLQLAKDAKVSLIVNNSRYLLEAVQRGDLDMAFIAKQQHHLPSTLESKSVAAEPLVVVSRSPLEGKVLHDFIAYDQPSNTFRLVNEALKNYGVIPQISFYSTSPDVTLRLVLQSKGVAALPYLLVRRHITSGLLHCLGGQKPWLIPRDIIAIKRRDKELSSALKQLTYQAGTLLDKLAAEAQTHASEGSVSRS